MRGEEQKELQRKDNRKEKIKEGKGRRGGKGNKRKEEVKEER